MKISIIIPVYNIDKYIEQCLDSILCQLTQDVEVIIVDDGSTDRCGDICDAYGKTYANVTVIHKENGGVDSARKAGMKIARGDYIMPVDGDDWLEDNALAVILEAMKGCDGLPDVISYGHARVSAGGERTRRQSWRYRRGYYSKEELQAEVYPTLLKPNFGGAFPWHLCGKVIRRELYCQFQQSVPNGIVLGEDALVSIPCIFFAKDMYVIQEPLYNYRCHPTSLTQGRGKPIPWNHSELSSKYLRSLIPLDRYHYEEDMDMRVAHGLFHVGKSHFGVKGANYFQVKEEMTEALGSPYYANAIVRCRARFGTKDWLAQFALKNHFYFLIYLYAKLF